MSRLIRLYMCISGIFAVAVAIVIYLHHRDLLEQLVHFAESENTALAHVFLNTVRPRFEGHVFNAGKLPPAELRDHPFNGTLAQTLLKVADGAPVLKIKIYDLDGLTIFSTDPSEIGIYETDNEGYLMAREGKPASELTYTGSLSAFSNIEENRDLVETYIPIISDSSTIQGVFELYTDVTNEIAGVTEQTTKLLTLSVCALVVFYLALYFLIRRAQRTIQVQYDDISTKKVELENEIRMRRSTEDALRKAHSQLEERVEERTRELSLEIEERKQVEESLRKLTVAVEQSPAMIMILDTAGNIEYVNLRFTQITGYTLEDANRTRCLIPRPTDDADDTRRPIWSAINAGREWHGELRERKKNGEVFWTSTSVSPIKDKSNATTHFLAVSEDITARKRFESAIREHQNQLAHVGRVSVMGEMASSLAHELNQPLTVISGTAQLALSTPPPDSSGYREPLRQIAEQADRAEQIVRRVRGFIKKSEIDLQISDVNAMVADTMNLLSMDARDHDIELEIYMGRGLPAVRVDQIQIEQVLLNLVHNAVEAMQDRPDILPRTITITSGFGDGTNVEIVVHNPGPVISPSKLSSIFDPFVTYKTDGLGMGLTIASSIAEAHGGRLRVESSEDIGTRFILTLPAITEPKT